MTRFFTAGALALCAIAAPAQVHAQAAQQRTLEVPAQSAWQHALTSMILPPQAGGLTRSQVADLGAEELDILAQYAGPDGTVATVYLFRTGVPDVALWFDRAAFAISVSPQYGLAGAALPAPTPFMRPGATIASGLRVALDLNAASLRSTALAVAPLGSHLLKIRLSSGGLDRAAIDARMTRFIEDLRWPAAAAAESAAAPVLPCAAPLRLRRARLVRMDIGDSLLAALSGMPREPKDDGPRPVFCREPGATAQYGVYRPGGSRQAYLVALGDAGIALSLGQAISLTQLTGGGGGPRRISMTLLDRSSTGVLPSFDRLPPLAQAVSVAFSGRGPGISVSTTPGN